MKYLPLPFLFLFLHTASLFSQDYKNIREEQRLCYKAMRGNLYVFDESILDYGCYDYGRVNIAYYLARYNPNWNPVDEDILKLRSDRTTVASVLAKHNPYWNINHEPSVLKEKIYAVGKTYKVAHYLAEYNPNFTTNDPKVLKITTGASFFEQDVIGVLPSYSNPKTTVAHLLARYKANNRTKGKSNWVNDDKEILKLKDKNDRTVAHILAERNPNWATNDLEILTLRDKTRINRNRTVAHLLAQYNPNWITDNKQILELKDDDGFTVYHALAKSRYKKFTTNDPNILKLQDGSDKTVAHYLAEYNPSWSTKDKEILELEDDRGVYSLSCAC